MKIRYSFASTLSLIGLCAFNSTACTKKQKPENQESPIQSIELPSLTEQPPLLPGAISVKTVVAVYKEFEVMVPPVAADPALARLCGVAIPMPVPLVDYEPPEENPHEGAQISVSMNALASKAYRAGDSYPEGAAIVKSKYSTPAVFDKTRLPNGVGGMIKRHLGYSPGSGDWEYFYYEKEDAIEHGLIQSCVQCHSKAAATDFVFGNWGSSIDGGY